MHSLYNRVAGQNVDRLAALSDGIFSVAMTLLVLDLRVPAAEAIHSEHDLRRVLIALSPRLLVFLMSIMTNGIFWVGQQTQLNYFAAPTAIWPGFTSVFSAPSASLLFLHLFWQNSSATTPRSSSIGATSSYSDSCFIGVGATPRARISSSTACRAKFTPPWSAASSSRNPYTPPAPHSASSILITPSLPSCLSK